MVYRKRGVVALVGLWLVLGSIGFLWAQSDRGTITGTVTDPSNAVIGGASVTARNTATGIRATTTTSSAGDYTVPLLRAGAYRDYGGTDRNEEIRPGRNHLASGTNHPRQRTMQIGQTTQTVQVSAPVELLQKDTSDRGTVVTSRDVEELPIVSQRNSAIRVLYDFGSRGDGARHGDSHRQWLWPALNTTVNGSPSGSTEFHLDGAVLGQGYMLGATSSQLPFPPDAVGEFNVMTLNPPAEYGQTGLGITAFRSSPAPTEFTATHTSTSVTRPWIREDFFLRRVPALKQNEFGITVGGPVVIPKLYNGRDKTFFFGWYDGFRLRQAATNSLTLVPTRL